MLCKGGRLPVGVGGVAFSTVLAETKLGMARICSIVVMLLVAALASRGGTAVTGSMAVGTYNGVVGAGKWKGCGVVIKNFVAITAGVTFEAGPAVVGISAHITVFLVHILLVVFVAADAAELRKIIADGVTVGTAFPFTFVFS